MKVQNAIRKLERAGFTPRTNLADTRYSFDSPSGRDVVEFATNPGCEHVIIIRVRGVNDRDDHHQDYIAGVYADNMTQAIRLAGGAA